MNSIRLEIGGRLHCNTLEPRGLGLTYFVLYFSQFGCDIGNVTKRIYVFMTIPMLTIYYIMGQLKLILQSTVYIDAKPNNGKSTCIFHHSNNNITLIHIHSFSCTQ